MLGARSSPLYMPTMLLALCDLVDQGLAPGGVVRFEAIEPIFDGFIAPIFPGGVGKAWQPFFHLSRSAQLWTLFRGTAPASFATLQARRPKSRGSLVKRADRAVLEPSLWHEIQQRSCRVGIAAALLSALRGGTPLRQRLGQGAGGPVGRSFAGASAPVLTAQARPIEYNPATAHAGAVVHHALCQQLAQRLSSRALRPLEPRAIDPQFDLGWRDGPLHIVEVKSLSVGSEDHQLRLGLGQVLEYRHRIALREGQSPGVFLAVERPPKRRYWAGACQDAGVRLVFGPRWVGFP
jgi:hypothetical protein